MGKSYARVEIYYNVHGGRHAGKSVNSYVLPHLFEVQNAMYRNARHLGNTARGLLHADTGHSSIEVRRFTALEHKYSDIDYAVVLDDTCPECAWSDGLIVGGEAHVEGCSHNNNELPHAGSIEYHERPLRKAAAMMGRGFTK